MIVLGFDPGTHRTGWCILDVRVSIGAPPAAMFVDAGDVASVAPEIASMLRSIRPDVVGVETLEGIVFPAKGAGIVASLIASSRVAGLISGVAFAHGLMVDELSARAWRKRVLGKPSAKDSEIKSVLPGLIHGWPTRSNVHVRDAGGLALGVGWSRATAGG